MSYDDKMNVDMCENMQMLSPYFFPAGIEGLVYHWDKCLDLYSNHVEILTACPAFLVLFDIYMEVTGGVQ
jgi:hypothetical protein